MQPPPPPALLIPRPRPQAEAFAAALEAAAPGRWRPVIAPLMEIGFRAVELPEATDLVFTSANGVAAYRAAGGAPGLRAICVGAATGAAAREAGLEVEVLGPDAAALGDALAARPVDPAQSFLHLRGAHAWGDLAGRLAEAGHQAAERIVYDQAAVPLPADVTAALAAGGIAAVALFSPRSARLLARAMGETAVAPGTRLACLSAQVAEAAAAHFPSLPVACAAEPSREAMIALLQA